MNRSPYFDYIEEKLNVLAARIISRGKLNVLNLHLHSENFYLHFFNLLFDWKLENLNTERQNIEAIDLIDKSDNKIIVQVSATNTKEKIESTLKKDIIKNYSNYNFKFISIAKDANELRKKLYDNPYKINFNPSKDIFDIHTILNLILPLEINKKKTIYRFIQKELGQEIDIVKVDSNLTTIINILAKENLTEEENIKSINSFEIDRKISHNNLISSKLIIEDYKIHHNRVDKIYSEFDKQGSNKSSSVLSSIRNEYVRLMKIESDDDLFFKIIDNIVTKIQNSANFVQIPIDELEQCLGILVVDAFIRCKIFENPENYKYANT